MENLRQLFRHELCVCFNGFCVAKYFEYPQVTSRSKLRGWFLAKNNCSCGTSGNTRSVLARESCQAGVQHCRKTSNPLDLHRRWFEEGTVWSWREAKPSWRHCQHSNAGSNQLTIYIPRRLFMRVSNQELHQQTKRIDCSGGTRESSHQQQEKGIQSRAQPPNLARVEGAQIACSEEHVFHTGTSVSSWMMSLFWSEQMRPWSFLAAKHLRVLSVLRVVQCLQR